jgi:HSP90 family molecular chaperone
MSDGFISIQFDKSHLSTIGQRLYSQSLDLIRELVANGYDADATEVKISLSDSSIIVEDNGAGMDKEGLKQYFIIGSEFKKQHPVSEKFKRVRIGEFGIGKFAVLSICDRFEIYTRSKNYAATLIFDRQDFEKRSDWNIPLIEHRVDDSPTTGTRVTLFSVKKHLSLFDVERHLINIFPLYDKNFSVYLNEKKLQSKFIPGERFKIKEETKFGPIYGEIIIASLLLLKEQVGIGVRVKNVLIKRDTFAIEKLHSLSVRRLTGEVNADFLPITASREDFVKDTPQYEEFIKVISKKLRRVIRSLEKSTLSYRDKKAEKILSDALITVREALKKNKDILLLDNLPLFSKAKRKLAQQETIKSGVIATALSQAQGKQNRKISLKEELREALKIIKPKIRSRLRTLIRDDHRIVKKVKIGGNEFLVSFAHLGEEEKESFIEGGIIFINRDHQLFKKVEKKPELTLYHLIRLVTSEIIKLAAPRNLETAFDWHGKLIKDAFLIVKDEKI